MNKETWIIVANSTHARLFRLDKLRLVEMDALVHPEGRMHEKDLVSDKPGTVIGGTGRYAMKPAQPPKKIEAEAFAKQVAGHIGHARASGKIDRLFLAASPNFLGLLRGVLDQQTINLIAHEVSKDITHLNPEDIRGYFPIGL